MNSDENRLHGDSKEQVKAEDNKPFRAEQP